MGGTDGTKTALVLSGGGAYAAYAVGVLKALCAGRSPATGGQKLRAGIFVGTSAGAVNAAVMASQPERDPEQTADYLQYLWLEKFAEDRRRGHEAAIRMRGDPGVYSSPSNLLRHPLGAMLRLADDSAFFTRSFFSRVAAFASSEEPPGRRVVELLSLTDIIVTDKFRQIVARDIDYAGIRRSDKVLLLTATNFATGALKLFGKQDLTNEVGPSIVEASASFPGLPPIMVHGVPYVDGGYIMSRPLQPAWEAGASTMHVIYHRPEFTGFPLRKGDNLIDVLDQLFHAMQASIFDLDLQLVRDINKGLAALDGRGLESGLQTAELRGILRMVGRLMEGSDETAPYRKLTVHRYHPQKDISGAFGIVNFQRENFENLIETGFRDTVNHDCVASGCIFPD